jgi:hypothetical protein
MPKQPAHVDRIDPAENKDSVDQSSEHYRVYFSTNRVCLKSDYRRPDLSCMDALQVDTSKPSLVSFKVGGQLKTVAAPNYLQIGLGQIAELAILRSDMVEKQILVQWLITERGVKLVFSTHEEGFCKPVFRCSAVFLWEDLAVEVRSSLSKTNTNPLRLGSHPAFPLGSFVCVALPFHAAHASYGRNP